MAVVSSCRKVSCYIFRRKMIWKFTGICRESDNERDLCPQLLTAFGTEHIVGTALETGRKVQATVGLYAPNPLGYTRATMVRTMGCNSERRS